MKPNLTGKAYDQITHRWARDTFNNENGIDQHERAIAFVESCGIALDVGCGCNSRYLECLTSKGFVYEGLDVSEEMISLARKQIQMLFSIMRIYVNGKTHKNMTSYQLGTVFGMCLLIGKSK